MYIRIKLKSIYSSKTVQTEKELYNGDDNFNKVFLNIKNFHKLGPFYRPS